ncbi:J domain-containing protein [Winogradskyella endarachnes]|uniref:DnaJ domain-containing protein n=1 Tax=Winogradskyella endarachnes TaxID=2681965 RepID=A0A6L6U7C3_9FLAO|nr:J domain-containing protein [Winogradskyella endarachnes]MUU78181.1 DnaJ domain-containing protein [Winogradskyella endarachnes]
MITNYYNILNIEASADLNTIKKAFRKEIAIFHPDNNNSEDAKARFNTIVEAFDVLSNTAKRKEYNNILRVQKENPPIVIEQKETVEIWKKEAKEKSETYSAMRLDNLFLLDLFLEVGVNGAILGTEVVVDAVEPIIDNVGDILGDVIGGVFDAF